MGTDRTKISFGKRVATLVAAFVLTGASVFGATPVAFAQPATNTPPPAATPPAATPPAETPPPAAETPAPAANATTAGNDRTGTEGSSAKCDLLRDFMGCILQGAGKIAAVFLWVFVSFLAWMLGIVGMFFNWIMLVTVFQFSVYFGNSEGMLLAWSILRDLGNIILLFGFIFIGIQTILNIGHFSVGRALPRLIIFAILINFSLFISEAIVDISNVLSSTFFSLVSNVDCTQMANSQECAGKGLAGQVMQASGLSGVFSFKGLTEIIQAPDGIQMFTYFAGMAVFMIVMMVAIGAAAIMFVIRAITLVILLVVSPLGFAGMAIPQFEEQAGKWWKTLISQSFFAPIYLLFMFIGLKILEGARGTFSPGTASLSDALGTTNVSSGGLFIIFALAVGFMVAAMTMSKQLGAMGASFAVSVSGKAVGNVTVGSVGFAGRHTVGAAANNMAAKVRSSEFAQRRPIMAGMVLKPLDYGKNASFDARSAGLVKTGMKSSGVDLGAPNKDQKHGFHGVEEAMTKRRLDYYKELKPAESQKNPRLKDIDGELEQAKNDLRAEVQKADSDITAARQLLAEAQVKGDEAEITAGREALSAAIKNRADVVTKGPAATTIKELGNEKKMYEKEAKQAMTDTYVARLSQSHHTPIIKSSAIGHADHEAVEKITKENNMSEIQKALKKIEDKTKGKEEDDHGDDHGAAGGTDHGTGAGDHAHGPKH